MDRPGTARAVLVSLAVVVLVACERDEPPSTGTPRPQAPTTTSTIEAPPGSYEYEGLGVAAVLTFDGAAGELEVRNDTEVELGEPHLYLFRADDGARVDLTTSDPTPVAPGRPATFEVAFEAGSAPPIGMIFLMFGDDDFGAFVPARGTTA